MKEDTLELENEKIGKYRMTGYVAVVIGEEGSYDSESEILEYELQDAEGNYLDDIIENDENLKEGILIRVIDLIEGVEESEESEEDSYDDPDSYNYSPKDFQ